MKTVQLTEARGKLAGARVVRDGLHVMLISTAGTVIRMPVEDVKRLGRATQGVTVMRLRGGDEHVSSLALVAEADDRRGRSPARAGRSRASAPPCRRREEPLDSSTPSRSGSLPLHFGRFSAGPFPKRLRRYTFARGHAPLVTREASMAYTEPADFLEPINLADHLDKVELYLGQVCQIAGISKMQLDYWTNKAQIPTKGKKQRIYDIEALETVMLIKQAKDKGLNLGAAIDAARRFRETRRAARQRVAI